MLELIKPSFDTALEAYDSTVSLDEVTYIYHKLIYTIGGLNLIVHLELMDSYFYIEIRLNKNKKKYSISDYDRGSDPIFQDNGITYLDIFDFNNLSEEKFKLERDELIKKRRKLFVWKKYIIELAGLYGNLVSSSLDNILAWESSK